MVWGFWSPSRWYSKFHLGWNASTFTTIAIRSFLSYLGLGIDFLSFIGSGDAYTTLLLSFGSRLILHFTLWIFFWVASQEILQETEQKKSDYFLGPGLISATSMNMFQFFQVTFCQWTAGYFRRLSNTRRKYRPPAGVDPSFMEKVVAQSDVRVVRRFVAREAGAQLLRDADWDHRRFPSSITFTISLRDLGRCWYLKWRTTCGKKRDASNITDRGLQDVFCRDSPKVSEISSVLYLQLVLLGNLKNGWHGHGVLVDSPCWEMKKSKVPDIRKRWDFFDDLSSKLQKEIRSSSERTKSWQLFSSSVFKDGLRFSCDISDWFQKIGRRQHSGVSKCFKSPLLMQRSARGFAEEHGFIIARIESLQQCWRAGFRRERRWTTIDLYI